MRRILTENRTGTNVTVISIKIDRRFVEVVRAAAYSQSYSTYSFSEIFGELEGTNLRHNLPDIADPSTSHNEFGQNTGFGIPFSWWPAMLVAMCPDTAKLETREQFLSRTGGLQQNPTSQFIGGALDPEDEQMGNDWIAYMASEMKWEPAPMPWTSRTVIIATMWAVGYAKDTDHLLVISETGRGVFDCITGEKMSRDHDTNYAHWWDKKHLEVQGIPPIANQTIRMVGHDGGGLKTVTSDGWRLEIIAPYWPLNSVVLSSSFKTIRDGTENSTKIFPRDDLGGDILALGFSDTEKSFIVADRSSITMFSRP